MLIIYKELNTQEHLNECLNLQHSIFNLDDLNKISPLVLNLLIVREPKPIGFIFGIFKKTELNEKLLGIAVCFNGSHKGAVYIATLGLAPEYQNKSYGITFIEELGKHCLGKHIDTIYFTFNPLNLQLAKIYIRKFGMCCTQYLNETNSSFDHKLCTTWMINSMRSINHFSNTNLIFPAQVSDINQIFQISSNIKTLKIPDIEESDSVLSAFFLQLNKLINIDNLYITGCVIERKEKIKSHYYILEKPFE